MNIDLMEIGLYGVVVPLVIMLYIWSKKLKKHNAAKTQQGYLLLNSYAIHITILSLGSIVVTIISLVGLYYLEPFSGFRTFKILSLLVAVLLTLVTFVPAVTDRCHSFLRNKNLDVRKQELIIVKNGILASALLLATSVIFLIDLFLS